MRLEYQILCAMGLDLLVGDPRWFPHPVRLIGWFAMRLEEPMRCAIRHERMAGLVTALSVIGVTIGVTWGLVRLASVIHPWLGTAVSILLLYTTMAARDLASHAWRVLRALRLGNLTIARQRVSWMVGRDTDNLDETGVVRAAVESVAENTVDGVTAPLFFAVMGGPIGAMAYKAINTLDSTFGYKNERYLRFGWASARIDDCANFLPVRLTLPCILLAASVMAMRPVNALKIALRDRKKHASPNSGIAEAAAAGALGVQLGGMLHRKGIPVEMPRLGDPLVRLERDHITKAIGLMIGTAVWAALCFLALRWSVIMLLAEGA